MSPRGIFLRDYQQEIISQVMEAWKQHRSIMVQMPTGTGKTHVLANIVSSFSGKILIVAHRVELVEQIRATVEVFSSVAPFRMTQELNVSSIQSIARRIDKLDSGPDLVIIDEAHHALAKTYRILWEKWPQARFLGLTATPCRMDRNGFTELFDTLVTSWSIAEFIRKGVLSAFDYVTIRTDSETQRMIDALEKRNPDGDYQTKEMDRVLNRQANIERLYQSLNEFARGKKGIVYAINIDHARKIAAYYSEKGIKAAAIDSLTPTPERKRLVENFKTGELEVLVNVDVFSEGFDCPETEFVQMARPTLSLAKYLQQVGRGLRKSKGKEACMMIDNVGLYRTFGLPVLDRDWKRMFKGDAAGKGQHPACTRNTPPLHDTGMEWVISHQELLAQLHKEGAENRYITIFDNRPDMIAVRFENNDCGLVDSTGRVIWRKKGCQNLSFARNHFLKVVAERGKECYVDLYNLQTYQTYPEVKRYPGFELLKVGHTCYSRTRKRYQSDTDYENLYISIQEGMLSICEPNGKRFCLLENDGEDYYRILHRLPDESLIVCNADGQSYHLTRDKRKVAVESSQTERLEEEIRRSMEAETRRKRLKMQEECKEAVPYQSGSKWGLKSGNRIVVPPIYRNIQSPVGKYCAVEMNYNQWGIICIDGTVLITPHYSKVFIGNDGTALLTQVTGKEIKVKLQ